MKKPGKENFSFPDLCFLYNHLYKPMLALFAAAAVASVKPVVRQQYDYYYDYNQPCGIAPAKKVHNFPPSHCLTHHMPKLKGGLQLILILTS